MSVANLADYRKKPVKKQELPDSPRYFCLRCNTDDFKLYETGAAHCRCCGSLIRNLVVVVK